MWNKALTYILLSCLISCGDDYSSNSDEFEQENEDFPEPETIQKIYQADLKAINPTVADGLRGQVLLRLEGDSFEANVAAQDVPGVFHPQHIRTGKSCPGPEADRNQDGLIDFNEVEVASGAVYIPLDSDLTNVVADNAEYPNGGFVGAYVYQEETTRRQIVSELGAESTLELENRVVIILGVELDQTLPSTVPSPDGRPPQETFPLACGELTKITGPE